MVVNSIPDGITFRQLIGWVAMLDSANARVDINGNLQLIKWNFDSVSVDYGATVGADGYLVFGGGSSADSNGFISPNVGNWYLDSDGYLTLKEGVGNPTRLRDYLSSPTLSSDDIVITGIKVKNTESDAMYGKDGYVLELENNLLSDADLGTVAGWIGDNLIGKSFRSMEGSLIYNPLTEFGDMAFTYDRKENKYITPITDVSSRLNGTTDVKTKAENPIRGSSKFLSSADKTLIAAKKIIENEKTAREQAVKKLENALANSEGLFETLEVLEDKSVITYLHDKPLLEESKVVIKLTSNAIGVSNDGGDCGFYVYKEEEAGENFCKNEKNGGKRAGWRFETEKLRYKIYRKEVKIMKKLEEYVRSIPDFPEPGIIFRDITTILQDADGLQLAIDGIQKSLEGVDYDIVVGPESRGFIFGVRVVRLCSATL